MKRKLKTALKPKKSFEVWSEENNIELKEHTPITKRQRFSGWIRQKRVVAGLSSAVAVCLIFAILLPVLLLNKPEQDNPPKTYTSQNIVSEYIEIEELCLAKNILLFNRNQIIEFESVNIDIADDDENLVLSYVIKNSLIAANDKTNAFYINFRVRLYEHYEFAGFNDYLDLPDNFSIGDTKISYGIIEDSRETKKAHVKFNYKSNDYFLEVKGFEGATDITEETLKILLNDLLA